MVQAIWFLIHAIGVIVTVILISTIITRKKTQYCLINERENTGGPEIVQIL